MIQLLDFHAEWCGPCKAMEPVFDSLKKEYEGQIEFKRVDVEADGLTAGQFGVMGIPTFVILKDGKEVGRKVGAMPKDILKSWIDSSI